MSDRAASASPDTFVYTSPDDPRAAPLVAGLRDEYAERYREFDVNRTEPVEMDKYGPDLFSAQHGGAFLLLLRADRAIAGGAFKRYPDDETAEIKRVWTDAGHRRQGLARRVMDELEAQARRQGYRRLYLTTGIRQPEALALYLGMGYTPLFDVEHLPTVRIGLPFVKALVDGVPLVNDAVTAAVAEATRLRAHSVAAR